MNRIFFLALGLVAASFSGYFIFENFDIELAMVRSVCDASESGTVCAREWIGPISTLFTMAAVWYAARSVVETNRASDAAVRSTLDNYRSQLTKERELLKAMFEADEFRFLEELRTATRGGWIHANEDFGALDPIVSECTGFPFTKEAFDTPLFGGELGQRRRELSRLVDAIASDYRQLRNQYQSEKKVPSEVLDNIRFRTKAFLGMVYYYKTVVDEEIDVTAEAINEFDDENLHKVRKALLARAERQWDKRRKGLFERFIDRISIPIPLISRPKRGDYFEDESGLSPRAPSPHHVNREFELIPRAARKSRSPTRPKMSWFSLRGNKAPWH